MAAGQSKGLCACAPDGDAAEEGQSFDKLRTSGEGVSRREVLGVAVAIPLSSLPLDGGGQVGVASDAGRGVPDASPGSTSTPPLTPPHQGEGEWAEALAAYRAAEAAVEEAGRRCAAASRAEIGAAEDAFGDRLEALYDALRRLLCVPAPGIGAFLIKVDAAFEHEIATLCENDASIAAIRADVRRLFRDSHS